MGGLVSFASTWISNMWICSCHIGGCFFFNHASSDGVAVWVARRLKGVRRQKGQFRQAGQILPPQERGDFDGLNEQPLAARYIRRATYTCPSVNVMPAWKAPPAWWHKGTYQSATGSVADGLETMKTKNGTAPRKAESMTVSEARTGRHCLRPWVQTSDEWRSGR